MKLSLTFVVCAVGGCHIFAEHHNEAVDHAAKQERSHLKLLQVLNLFRLAFVKSKSNVIFLGEVGFGKNHLVTALAHTACLSGITVLFTTAIDVRYFLNFQGVLFSPMIFLFFG